jgi:hypothetical protein
VEHNDISAAGQGIVVCTEGPNTILQDISIINNSIHDFSSQIVGETHGDGIHTWNSPEGDASQYLAGLTIAYNAFYGDFSRQGGGTASMTSFIYLTDPGQDAKIFNNTFTCSPSTDFASFIWIRYFSNTMIYNNTLVRPGTMGGIGIMVGQGDSARNAVIKNNVLVNFQEAFHIYEDATPSAVIDNNCSFTTSGSAGNWNQRPVSVSEWKSFGNDQHSLFSDPKLVSATDFHLTAASLCRDAGEIWESAPFPNDKDGNRRTGSWDIGAFEYTVPPSGVPGTIKLLSPAPGETGLPLELTFRWQEPEDWIGSTASYSLFTSTDSLFSGSLPVLASSLGLPRPDRVFPKIAPRKKTGGRGQFGGPVPRNRLDLLLPPHPCFRTTTTGIYKNHIRLNRRNPLLLESNRNYRPVPNRGKRTREFYHP